MLENYPAGPRSSAKGSRAISSTIIHSGTVDVLVSDGRSQNRIATLTKGNYFGETALLSGEPRNATVVAAQPVELYSLDKTEFQAVIKASASLEQELRNLDLRPAVEQR